MTAPTGPSNSRLRAGRAEAGDIPPFGTPVFRAVTKLGGHLPAEMELVVKTGITDTSSNVGFVIVWKGNGTVQLLWNSGQINGRNFRNNAAPAGYRAAIREAVVRETGFTVIDSCAFLPESISIQRAHRHTGKWLLLSARRLFRSFRR